MIPEHVLKEQITSPDRQLLLDIRELLRSIDLKLTSENNTGDNKTPVDDKKKIIRRKGAKP